MPLMFLAGTKNMRTRFHVFMGLLCALAMPFTIRADVINFDSLDTGAAGIPVTNQFLGVTFTNALALTAMINLNEFDFPPYSGGNVVTDDQGPMTITFDDPVISVGGRFTYLTALTLSAYNNLGNPIETATSAFTINTGTQGEPGSLPNELISVNSVTGISRLVVTGGLSGGSFTLDDLTYVPSDAAPIPEPGSVILLASAIGLVVIKTRCRARRY